MPLSPSLNPHYTILLNNIKYLRLRHGLTCKQMAKLLNTSVRSIKRMERGELPLTVSAEVLVIIDREFGILPSNVLYKPLWK